MEISLARCLSLSVQFKQSNIQSNFAMLGKRFLRYQSSDARTSVKVIFFYFSEIN